jgi:hypothetical protein
MENGGVDERPGRISKPQATAVWLLVAVVFGGALAAWGTTINGLLTAPDSAGSAGASANFGTRQSFIATPGTGTPRGSLPNCVYGQSSQGMLIVMSASTGSLLTPEQAAHCTK